jgi:hypothetical protein
MSGAASTLKLPWVSHVSHDGNFLAGFGPPVHAGGFCFGFGRARRPVDGVVFVPTFFGAFDATPLSETRSPSLIEASLEVKRNNGHR